MPSHDSIRWTRELSLLKPKAADQPDDNWPVFVLTDAVIYRADGTTLANPLHTHLDGPMIIRGRLELDEDTTKLLARTVTKSPYIEIIGSDRYSIGFLPVTLWISGSAGWYEVVPAANYQPMYSQIREAITLYYGVMELYEEYQKKKKKKSKKGKVPSVEDALFRYAVIAGDGVVLHEAVERCHKWAKFMISHFPKENSIEWDDTPFAKWIYEKNPAVKKQIADVAAGLALPPAPPVQDATLVQPSNRSARASKRNSDHDEDVEMKYSLSSQSRSPEPRTLDKGKGKATLPVSNTPVALPTRYLRSEQPSPKPPSVFQGSSPTPEDPDSPIDRFLSVLHDIAAEAAAPDDMKKRPMMPSELTTSNVQSRVHFKCKVRVYGTAGSIIAYYAKDLLPRLGPEWHNGPFIRWLTSMAAQPYTAPEGMDINTFPDQLRRRARNKRDVKSGVPPPTNSMKHMSRQTTNKEDSDADVPGKYQTDVRRRSSGKAAILRLAPIAKKRPASEMDTESGGVGGSRRGRKSLKTVPASSDDDENMDDVEDISDAAIQEGNNEDVHIFNGQHVPIPKDMVRIVVHAEKIPSMSPAGPNGTWMCDQEGCGFIVRSADDPSGQETIQQHFRDHEAHAEKVNLALKEGARGHMPIKYAYFPPFSVFVLFPPPPSSISILITPTMVRLSRALSNGKRVLRMLHNATTPA
ncbi:hypothetical protein B0T17DRAFT_482119 [Bombardia bombarda]|uniref:DNA (cytosine-5)-methyltransferase 1 replication foci domain-containing protein n=1 Tax=Bombardia bombarda TaxID=252184 RepID=A0AA40CEV6_9PEZI|nr:hypothetical protein B0T17DRAFT_482119 [Bombardia bombarda]